MPDPNEWPEWDDEVFDAPAARKRGKAAAGRARKAAKADTAVAMPAMDEAAEDELDDFEPPVKKKRRRRSKGEMPDDWVKKKSKGDEEGDDEEAPPPPDDELSEEEVEALAAAGAIAVQQAVEEMAPAFRPIDMEALAETIDVMSPTRILLEIPREDGDAAPERTQKLVQVRRYEETLVEGGDDEDVAAARGREMLEGDWVRVQLLPHQRAMTEEICHHPIDVLVYKDPKTLIDRSMHAYKPRQTGEMAVEVAQLIAYYDTMCDLERDQLFQVELEAKVQAELAKKKKAQDKAVKGMLPKIVIDPKTKKKNAKNWEKAKKKAEEEKEKAKEEALDKKIAAKKAKDAKKAAEKKAKDAKKKAADAKKKAAAAKKAAAKKAKDAQKAAKAAQKLKGKGLGAAGKLPF